MNNADLIVNCGFAKSRHSLKHHCASYLFCLVDLLTLDLTLYVAEEQRREANIK